MPALTHLARLFVGNDYRYLLISSALTGGALLLLVSDIIARSLIPPVILPVGIITSFAGAPLFLYLLVQEPKVLLLDEPVNHLDVRNQLETMSILREVTQDLGLLTISVLHDLTIALRYADRFVLIKDGGLHACGHPRGLWYACPDPRDRWDPGGPASGVGAVGLVREHDSRHTGRMSLVIPEVSAG